MFVINDCYWTVMRESVWFYFGAEGTVLVFARTDIGERGIVLGVTVLVRMAAPYTGTVLVYARTDIGERGSVLIATVLVRMAAPYAGIDIGERGIVPSVTVLVYARSDTRNVSPSGAEDLFLLQKPNTTQKNNHPVPTVSPSDR
jgi:predicted membrane GTPase involved in stress response